MSNENDRETTTKKVTSHPNNSGDGYRVSEQRTTKVSNDNDNSATGLILGVSSIVAIGVAIVVYFLYIRPAPTPILLPNATEKSTIIERNNTTIKEVTPSPQPSAPSIQITVPAATAPPQTVAPAATTPPPTVAPTPAATTPPPTPNR